MKFVARLLLGALALSSIAATSRARADASVEPDAPVTPPEQHESAVQLHVDGSAGLTSSGALLSGLGLARFGLLELGGSYGASGLFSTRTGGGLALGIGGHRPGGAGWDLVLELGTNQHRVAGRGGLLSSDPGASGAIPYGGLRAGFDWSFGKASAVVHPTLGLWLFARADLDRRTASYAYQSTGWLSGSSESRTGSVTLGGGGEIGIALAGGFDLLP